MLPQNNEQFNGRQYHRVDVRTPCRFRLRTLGNKTFRTGELLDGFIENLSGGGLSFISRRDLPDSEMLAWQFMIEFDTEVLNLLGRIVWKRTANGDTYYYGVQFLFTEHNDQQRLINMLNRFQIIRRIRERTTRNPLA
ncbi:PilZ domain-containing protein [Tumebacillus permanentifrigoris]|uniref:PilZ domain-containing protein n=1 Tax=Tumebacillus permanentifrigoris TaxID=378543 RepID=A0A316DYD1_9BACL|nr:PilZ domain-containing protein [Tumebacillus permanentifrigoris]PWK15520.1 PilZ domain-containing protein [Tumebacillus permanentifrigoris]